MNPKISLVHEVFDLYYLSGLENLRGKSSFERIFFFKYFHPILKIIFRSPRNTLYSHRKTIRLSRGRERNREVASRAGVAFGGNFRLKKNRAEILALNFFKKEKKIYIYTSSWKEETQKNDQIVITRNLLKLVRFKILVKDITI